MITLDTLKKSLAIEYNMKDLGEVKTIIRWQVTRDMAIYTMKIDQSAFIRDLVIKEGFKNCNANVILIKAGSAIKMFEPDNYNKTNIYTYQ